VPFQTGGAFSGDNWNCATANAIRDLTGQDDPSDHADCRYCDDQWYSTIKVHDVELGADAYALWVTWYKHRGRTEGMWLLGSDVPARPTEADAVAIISALKQR